MCVSPVGSQDLLPPAQAPLARRPEETMRLILGETEAEGRQEEE